jgi:hypothetical protein
MNDRIHRAIDGELDVYDLSPQERRQLAAFASVATDLAQALRQVPRPDLTERVMAALPRTASPTVDVTTPSRVRAMIGWLWRPRPLALEWRPAYAAAAIVLLVLGMAIADRLETTGGGMTASAASAQPVLFVQFRLEAPGAASVEVSGSFTNWDSPVPLVESAPGVWSTLVALEPGVHDYAFVVDGETWVADPTAPAVDDGFGGTNSRLFLTRPTGNV